MVIAGGLVTNCLLKLRQDILHAYQPFNLMGFLLVYTHWLFKPQGSLQVEARTEKKGKTKAAISFCLEIKYLHFVFIYLNCIPANLFFQSIR